MKITLFQAILFGAFGLSALVGLFVFATYTNKSGGSAEIGTVVIWGTLPRDTMQSALVSATQANTALKNVSYVQKDPATLSGELASAIATGSAPDLVLDSQEGLHALSRFITPIPFEALSPSTFTNSFIQGAGIFTTQGGYYGIPFLVDPLVLFANRSILSSSGIARPPSTWEALVGLVPNVARTTATRQVTRGLIALGTYNNVHNARGILSALFIQTGVPISSYSASGMLSANLGTSESGGKPPGQAVLKFYTQFADPSKVSYTWNTSLPDSQQAFLSGDLALYLGYSSEVQYLRDANPNLNFYVVSFPQPATASIKNLYGRIYTLMIPRGAKNPSGAYQVAAILSGSAEQSVFAGATGLAPASLNVLAMAPADPADAVAYAEALYTSGWLSPATGDTDAIFSGMINNVISGRSTLQGALVSAGSALTELLQQ
ncbi:MAG: Uncharacterized protein G01um101491_311 [Parcubacteria group bacterium Gr01-1014_91]|nr:MAG: Uncharacterized protein G01um101491_311 [Parcubacteria group bacterium Gr01-1014_91]